MKIKYNLDAFINNLDKNRRIICIGIGKYFDNFLFEMKELGIENRIKMIVDNDSAKWGMVKKCNLLNLEIMAPQMMLQEISSEDVILITTAYYNDIINQLDTLPELMEQECYVSYFLIAEKKDRHRSGISVPEKIKITKSRLIPSKIHYCWFGGKEIPDRNKAWMESWKRHCPEFDIIQWNENNYDIAKSIYMKQAYEKKEWAFVSDYARLDIIYNEGGVYLDTDVELLKPLDSFLYQDAFCGFENHNFVNFGLGYGATRKNKIIGEILALYDQMEFVQSDGTYNKTACPVYQTKILQKFGLQCNGEYQIAGGMVVYPEKVFCGLSPHSFRLIKDISQTYSIHHFAASWLEEDALKRKENVIDFFQKGIN